MNLPDCQFVNPLFEPNVYQRLTKCGPRDQSLRLPRPFVACPNQKIKYCRNFGLFSDKKNYTTIFELQWQWTTSPLPSTVFITNWHFRKTSLSKNLFYTFTFATTVRGAGVLPSGARFPRFKILRDAEILKKQTDKKNYPSIPKNFLRSKSFYNFYFSFKFAFIHLLFLF